MKYMMHGQPMECSLGGFRLPHRQRHQKEIPHREVAQEKEEIPHREVAQDKMEIPLREVARGTSPMGTPRKEREIHEKERPTHRSGNRNTKAEFKNTRLKFPTAGHMYLAVGNTGFARSLDDPLHN